MLEYLQAHEAVIRLGSFAGIMVLMLVVERLWPRRQASDISHVLVNFSLVALNTLLLRLCFPVLAVGTAIWAAEHHWGLLNWFEVPIWLEVLVAVVLLDMAIYWQHRLMHAIPWLWRLHRVHHSDLVFDVSTGVRFHPVEIFVSMLIKMALVIVLGADAVAVIIFEVLLSASSLFEHTNLRLPPVVDRTLRAVIVTPDMHRIHHSVYRDETDSNFGFNLSVWDRLFASYCAQPRDEHTSMKIGLPAFREAQDQTFISLIRQPLRQVEPQ